MLCFFAAFAFSLFLKHRDVKVNPGPKKQDFFSWFHWNVNSILAHNKLSLLEAYSTIHKYDILCISETYSKSSVLVDETTLSHPGYNLVRSDHPSNIKRGVVCLYYKDNLSLRSINVAFLSECVLCEVTLQSQKCYVIVICRFSSQSSVEFNELLSNFKN